MAKDKVYIILEVTDKGTAVVKGFDKNTEQAFNKVKQNASVASSKAGAAMAHLKKHWVAYAASATAAGLVVAAVIKKLISSFIRFAKASVGVASNLEEATSKFNVVFADQIGLAKQWAKELVNSYAMSTREAKGYLSSVQDLLVPMGMASDQAGRMSSKIVKLAADLGSFNNLPTAQVMADIQSGLVGNYETMKKYGVVLNATIVQEKALAMGLAATKSELTAGQKAHAAYTLMVEGSKAAIGDMARTHDEYANQMKQNKATFENFSAAFGSFITKSKAVADAMRDAREWMIKVAEKVNAWREKNQELIDQKMEEYLDTTLNLLTGIAEAVKLVYKGYALLIKLVKDNGAVLNVPLIGQIAIIKKALEKWGEYNRTLKETGAEHEIITRKINDTRAAMDKLNAAKKSWGEPLEEVSWLDSHQFAESFKYDLGLINAELRVFQLQSEAAWAAYQKGMQETIPKQDEFMAGIYGERTAIMLLEQEIEEGLAQSFKSIDDQGVDTFDNLKNAVTGWGSTFSSQLNDMLWAADTTFKDILESFGKMLTQMMIQKKIVEPILGSDWFMNLGKNAHGNVFQNGSITPFARGGIVNRPTVFPMAGGMGLMGEKGPEAVMPLARTQSGDLGVKTEGGGCSNVTINMINQSGQSLEASQQGSRYASGKHIIDVVVKDLQRGGSLRQVIRSTI